MTSDEWVRNRTTDELMGLRRLLRTHKDDRLPFGGRVGFRLRQVEREIGVRVRRQVEFMDRLDGID